MILRLTPILLAALVSGYASTADALSVCIAPCTFGQERVEAIPVDEGALSSLVTDGGLEIVMGSGAEAIPIVSPGRVIVHIPSGTLRAASIDLRAGADIEMLDPVTLDVGSGRIALCSGGLCPALEGVETGVLADPLHITVLGPLSGSFDLAAGSDIFLTSAPIPEPKVALLVGLGLTALAKSGRGASGRQAARPCGFESRNSRSCHPRVTLIPVP
jgi:hypothetical protein